MKLEKRISELQREGSPEMINKLLTGVIAHTNPDNVSVEKKGNEITVIADQFHGRHQIEDEESLTVSDRGEYVFTGTNGDFNIELKSTNEEVAWKAEQELSTHHSEVPTESNAEITQQIQSEVEVEPDSEVSGKKWWAKIFSL